MKGFKIESIRYSPGYSDMTGGSYNSLLKKDKGGNWIYVASERPDHSSPTEIRTYTVAPGSVAEFEKFLCKRKVMSLSKRLKSDMFATDYSPWSWRISYSRTLLGRTVSRYAEFNEYRNYTRKDRELIRELQERFRGLPGELISETSEERK